MANFTGTDAGEIITPSFVSATVTATGGNLPSKAQDVIDGGAGNDTINGGGGDDVLSGGDGDDSLFGGVGNDTVTGGRGTDVAVLGAGNDRFIWNQGDGSDVVNGQGGSDTLEFNGASGGENITISANGPNHATLARDLGTITMDLKSIERIEVTPLGGADNITVNDLTGTGVKQVAIDLALPGSTGDNALDSVTLNGTAASNRIQVTAAGTMVTVSGLPEQVTINHAEPGDLLSIKSGAGNDTIDASALPAATMALTLDGGAGNDTIIGGHDADTLIGGDGNDTVIGGAGADVATLGAGDDTFIWNQGDGSDTVDGQGGFDTLVFNGAAGSENTTISANGTQATLVRDLGSITMHLDGVERIELSPLGGADNTTVNDLTGTSVKEVAIDLAAAGTTVGDGQPDAVNVKGTAGDDHITVTDSNSLLTVTGLPAQVTIAHGEVADVLSIDGGVGNDTIDASASPAGTMGFRLSGGDGNDVLLGGAGNDVFAFTFGESGHDVIQNFQVHGANTQGDVISLSGFADQTFDQAVADGHIAQAGADVVISDGTNIIATLQDISIFSLTAQDFLIV